jgi:chromosome partitioning protein
MAKIIAVLNQKGGVGKTTTVVNLAAYWAKSGRRVLIVDADPQGNATSGLGIDKNAGNTTYQLLLGRTKLVDAAIETDLEGVFIVPANSHLASAETELATVQGRERRMAQVLHAAAYDVVLIDCPPALGLLTINALVAADQLLVPVQAEYYAMEGLGQLLEVFRRVKQSVNPRIRLLGIVVTMYDSRTSLGDQVVAQLRKHFGELVFDTRIPRNVRLAEAPSYGKPISEHDRWSKGARAYKQLAKEVWERV